MKLSLAGLKDAAYAQKGYLLPNFDIDAMRQKTLKNPTWIHFGAGNILRAFPCVLLQRLLEAGETDRGMIVVESYDEEIIDKAFTSFDNLCLAVSLRNDGTVEKRIVASVAQALGYHHGAQERVTEIFRAPGLQMVTLTITEKGYAVLDAEGKPLSYCAKDFESMES
ncbi:MAG: mannitol dehydrogenase family protein, partial [Clostridia bacterium]